MASKDKMRLEDYVASIASQILDAVKTVEEEHPEWRVGRMEIVARGVLKPYRGEVWIDLDEPRDFPRSDIPIPLERRPA